MRIVIAADSFFEDMLHRATTLGEVKKTDGDAELELLKQENATLQKALREASERLRAEIPGRATTMPATDVHVCDKGCQDKVNEAGACVIVENITRLIDRAGITISAPLTPSPNCDCSSCVRLHIAEVALLRCEVARQKSVK